jgi:DNA-binding CsgD family transcriptional regulator
VSLEALTADDPDRHQIMSTGVPRYDLAGRLHSALVARARAEQTWTVEVAKRIGKGEQPAAVAAALGLDEQSVFRHMRAIARAAPNPRHQFSKISELRAALEQLAERDADTAARVGHELSEGATAGDVAAMLKIDISEVRDHEDAIRRVWHQIESEAG